MKQLSLFKEIPPNEAKKKKQDYLLGPQSNIVGYDKYVQSHDWKKKRPSNYLGESASVAVKPKTLMCIILTI